MTYGAPREATEPWTNLKSMLRPCMRAMSTWMQCRWSCHWYDPRDSRSKRLRSNYEPYKRGEAPGRALPDAGSAPAAPASPEPVLSYPSSTHQEGLMDEISRIAESIADRYRIE